MELFALRFFGAREVRTPTPREEALTSMIYASI